MGKKQKYFNIFITVLIVTGTVFLFSSEKKESLTKSGNSKISNSIYESAIDTLFPVSKNGLIGFPETVEQIMSRNKYIKVDSINIKFQMKEEIEVDRQNLPQNPASPNVSRYPKSDIIAENNYDSPQTVSTSFTAATLATTGFFPADDMGAVGPSQFIVAVNGRIISFNKSTGAADGVLNATTNSFFNSVRNGSGTSDPRIRYDRQTQRWFVVIINVSTPNRILIAVSDAASAGIISASTVWTYYFIPIDSTVPTISSTCLADYPTLGIDNNALYIGTNNFCGSPSQTFNSTDGYVIRKSSITVAGPMVVTVFRGLVATASSAGPYTPQGVDNFDAGSTEGYFIGVDNVTFGTLMIRRVSTPGGTPTISANISLTVPTTSSPITVPHLGNSITVNGRLNALDDRLFAAQMRSGRLWTAHNIAVDNTGATGTNTRNALRWYEIQNLNATPSYVQTGTVFDNTSPNDDNQRNYWIPTLNISGQGHVAMVYSTAGINFRVNVGTVGRLSSDALGTMQTPSIITASSTAYNPPSDPGTRGARRWGDDSYVSVDPNDDMTMWCVHQFCDATNSYGVRATKLLAPPPATITSISPATIPGGNPSFNLTVNGTSSSGSGFFDPGAGFANRISASVTNGVVVNSVSYVNPLQVVLNLNTTNITNSTCNITITNPDGQFTTYTNVPLPVNLSSFNYTMTGRDVNLKWVTASETNNAGFEVERASAIKIGGPSGSQNWEKIGYVQGKGNVNTPSNYAFDDRKLNSGKYKYRLKQIDVNGNFEYFALNGEVDIGVPTKFNLSQNYPNPFNPATKIDFDLPFDSKVNIVLYDMTGREVKTLVNETRTAGFHTVQFNASHLGGSSTLSSGIYFYRIVAKSSGKDFVMTKKMALLK